MTNEEILRKAIADYLSGDYPHPRQYRPDDCPHGIRYWSECEACNEEHFTKALAACALPSSTPSGE